MAIGFMRANNPPNFDEVRATIRHSLGLDQPIHIHYLRWMGLMKQSDGQYRGVFQGDLGYSFWEGR
jgi:ABC-type dipeptide/oligopeptide/nickel transport system permease component